MVRLRLSERREIIRTVSCQRVLIKIGDESISHFIDSHHTRIMSKK